MANIVNFTDKQFENRLRDNIEELVQGKKAVESPTAFLLGGQPGSGKPVYDRRFMKKHKEMSLSLIMIHSNNNTLILMN